jgi:putative hydrolase of the HAD superfamily
VSFMAKQQGCRTSERRFLDQFEVILLDMGRTFMFEVDRFGEHDDLGATYRRVGGNRLGDRQVHQILCDIFQQMVSDSKNPANYEKFPSVISYLQKHPESSSLPADEIKILEEVFFLHEKGTVPDDYVRTLRRLHSSHRLGIISDIWSRCELFYQELDRLGIRGLFEVIMFSSEVGIIKPSPRIFQMALESLAVEVSKAVYIGDSLRRDVAGAQSMGMATVWIQPDQIDQENLAIRPDCIVNDLRDVLL